MTRTLLAIALLAAALTAAPAARAQYGLGVSVYPSPGTISASTATQLSFRGVTRGAIGTITVRGSRSGRHSGTLRAHSDGRGASWLPRRRFSQGETVTVRTALPIRGARGGDFRFRTERVPRRLNIPQLILEDIDPGKRHRFRSRPDLAPPLVTVGERPKPTDAGYVFLSPKSKKDLAQAGPMIVDNAGRPIFFRPLPGITAATDVRAQTYKGRPVITWWEGTSRIGIGTGRFVMMDEAYRIIKVFQSPNGYRGDLHELLITPRDTAVVIVYPIVKADLRKLGGRRAGDVVDSVTQEIDLETGLVIFEWHSLGKIALADSFTRPAPNPRIPFDYAHFNSVDVDADGDFIVSARNTWGIYKIDRETGRIIWQLGGKRSTYRLGRGVRFAWQHDARRRSDGAITLFDNSAFPPVRKHSRALAIDLDDTTRRATLVSARKHPRGLLAATQGSHQTLPRGGAFVGWGSQRYFTEYDPAGRVLWDARLSVGYESYRAYRMPWTGRPATPPAVAGRRRGGGMDVYASWNGATEVARWVVLGGDSPSRLSALAEGPRAGFETRIAVPARTRYVAVRALDAAGSVLATSLPRRVAG